MLYKETLSQKIRPVKKKNPSVIDLLWSRAEGTQPLLRQPAGSVITLAKGGCSPQALSLGVYPRTLMALGSCSNHPYRGTPV